MNAKTTTLHEHEMTNSVHYMPSVSIILPFDPTLNSKTRILQSLRLAADQVEREISKKYSNRMADLVRIKIGSVSNKLDFKSRHKSMAIYVSPVFENVLYLDIPVETKIIVDESVAIRELIQSNNQNRKYLVLLLAANSYRIYVSNSDSFARMLSNIPHLVHDHKHTLAEGTGDAMETETNLHMFLRHVDDSLNIILIAYPLPLFVAGSERITGLFKKCTRHGVAVVDYIPGNHTEATRQELKNILLPFLSEWEKIA